MHKNRRKSRIGSNITVVFVLIFLLSTSVLVFLHNSYTSSIESNERIPIEEEDYRLYLLCENQIETLKAGLNETHGLVHMFGTYGGNNVVSQKCRNVWNVEIQTALDSLNKLVNVKSQLLRKDKAQKLRDDFQFYMIDAVNRIQDIEFEIFRNWQGGWTSEDGERMTNISEDIDKLDDTIKKFLTHFEAVKPSLEVSKPPISLLSLLIITVILGLLFILAGTVLKARLIKPILKLNMTIEELSKGDIPDKYLTRNGDFVAAGNAINELSENLRNIQKIAEEVGKGQFDHDIKVFNDSGELGDALAEMKESLKQVYIEDQQRNKVNEGLAKFSEILGNYTNDLSKFGDEVVFNLVKFLDANQGAMFTVSYDDEEKECLEIMACYAYDKKKYISKKIYKGQGLVGQAWQEGKRIYLTEVPNNYVTITSGLGYSTPRCVLIIPLNFNEITHGVIEIASFRVLEPFELEFIEKAGESIASALASVKVNDRTQKLLAESKELTEQMRAQEEEMRQNMEELQATQEEMQRREDERINEIDILKKKLKQMEA